MDETYRILGKEHEAELEREAQKWRRADEVRGRRRPSASAPAEQKGSTRLRVVTGRLLMFVARTSRANEPPRRA
jgi:hypothetical protein